MSRRGIGGNWQNHGSAAGELMYPNREGIRGELKKKGIRPRDHHLDNIRKIKNKQMENRIKKEASKTKIEPFRMKKFKNVESRVFSSPKLKALQKERTSPENEGVNRRRRKIRSREADPNDAISRNRRNIKKVKRRKGANKVKKLPTKHNYGEVPKYLVNRKNEWKEKEDLRKARLRKRRECPKGMVLMQENDRVDTLTVLSKNKQDICTMIGKLPIICDTVGLKRKKIQLENKLEEIENAIKLFSKKKVYIAE